MRHRKSGAKLGRTTSHRKAMLRNMVTSLFDNGKLVTTTAKAKAAAPLAEKMITLAKRGDLHARRQALAFLTRKDVTHKLFEEIKDRYMDRSGGYTSIIRVGIRKGDAAEMSLLALIDPEERAKAAKKAKKKKPAKKKTAPAKEATTAETAPEPEKEEPKQAAPVEEKADNAVEETAEAGNTEQAEEKAE